MIVVEKEKEVLRECVERDRERGRRRQVEVSLLSYHAIKSVFLFMRRSWETLLVIWWWTAGWRFFSSFIACEHRAHSKSVKHSSSPVEMVYMRVVNERTSSLRNLSKSVEVVKKNTTQKDEEKEALLLLLATSLCWYFIIKGDFYGTTCVLTRCIYTPLPALVSEIYHVNHKEERKTTNLAVYGLRNIDRRKEEKKGVLDRPYELCPPFLSTYFYLVLSSCLCERYFNLSGFHHASLPLSRFRVYLLPT